MVLRLAHTAVTAQALSVIVAMGAMALWPSSQGPWLLVSPSGRQGDAVSTALSADARLLARGPLAGSLVVSGDRASLISAARRFGLIVLAAPSAWCGAPASQSGAR